MGNLNNENSNTIAVDLANVAGLKSGVLDFITENHLSVPGYNANLEHSAFEKTETFLYDSIKSIGETVSDFVHDLSSAIENGYWSPPQTPYHQNEKNLIIN
jgi:hypothetical protein